MKNLIRIETRMIDLRKRYIFKAVENIKWQMYGDLKIKIRNDIHLN